ncbi:hypothetical protein V8F33_013014 [Rhypophila sp. PSN 637]
MGPNGGQARDNTSLDELLKAVAKALASMPKLEILEIWNAKSGQEDWTGRTTPQGAIFRYEHHSRKSGSPTLTWCSSWDTSLSSGVIKAWDDALSQQDAPRDMVVGKSHDETTQDAGFGPSTAEAAQSHT